MTFPADQGSLWLGLPSVRFSAIHLVQLSNGDSVSKREILTKIVSHLSSLGRSRVLITVSLVPDQRG